MKGRDVLIGVAIGAFLVLFLTNYHSGKPHDPHPKSSASAQAASTQHGASSQHVDKTHHQAASKHPAPTAKHTAAAKPRPANPTAEAQPSAHRLSTGKAGSKTTGKAASAPAKSSGISDGLIVIACLIAIAAALSTVTLTVRGLRVAK